MRAALVAVAALLVACGAEPWPSTLYLAPADAELAAMAVAADDRWEAAGVASERVVVVPPGMPDSVPLRWQPDATAVRRACKLPDSYPHDPGGCVVFSTDGVPVRVWISRTAGQGCMDHEWGHPLGVVDHIAADGALMREDSGNWRISEPNLEAVCERGACTGWAPEIP